MFTTGNCRDGFSFTGSSGIINIPSIIKQAKERMIEKEDVFMVIYYLIAICCSFYIIFNGTKIGKKLRIES
jgi:hypothetical protein